MKKLFLIISVMLVTFSSKAQFEAFDTYDKVASIVTMMRLQLPMEAPGFGSITDMKINPEKCTFYFKVDDASTVNEMKEKIADSSYDATGELINNFSGSAESLALLKMFTNIGLNVDMVFFVGEECTPANSARITITPDFVEKATNHTFDAEQSFLNMFNNARQELASSNEIDIDYNDNMFIIDMIWPDEEEFAYLQLGFALMDDESRIDLFKEMIDENVIVKMMIKACANTNRGITLRYHNPDNTATTEISVNASELKSLL